VPVGQDFDILLANQYRSAHLNLINGWIDLSKKTSVLKTDLFAEAMCPTRSFFWGLLKLNPEITGMDISPEICLKAKQMSLTNCAAARPEFSACDLRYLPFENSSFDVVISDSTLDHYRDKKEIKAALKELVRVLKPGGALIVTMDNKTNITEPLFRLWIAVGLSPFYIGKTYSMKELKKAVEQLGLNIDDSQTLLHNPRFFTKLIISILRRAAPGKCEKWTIRLLNYFDSLGSKNTRFLTAQFIAVKAVKK
jgi:SAM-dependent methyltransferase